MKNSELSLKASSFEPKPAQWEAKFNINKPKEIVLLKGDGNYTWVYFQNGTKVLICKSLVCFSKLINNFDFIRIHKTYIVNMQHIVGVDRYAECIIHLTNGFTVEVARRRKREIKSTLNSYMGLR